MPVTTIALVDVLPDHLLIEILSRLVETVGLRASVASARSVCRLLRTCVNAALEHSLNAISSRTFDSEGLSDLVRCILYDRSDHKVPTSSSPRFLSLKSVVLTGCKGINAQALSLLLKHSPEVETLQVEGTAVRPEETDALAHMTRRPIAAFRLGTWTALHEAVSSARRFAEAMESGGLDVGGSLSGIYVDVCNERGLTPLLVAAYNGVTDAAKWLLSNGACPDACDCYHVSALMKASYFGHASTVRVLLQYGANSSRVDMYGAGALAKAAYRGHTAVVRLLLAAGARTDGEDLYGNRPLHSAVASGHRNIAMMLLQYGAKHTDSKSSSTDAVRQRRSSGSQNTALGSGAPGVPADVAATHSREAPTAGVRAAPNVDAQPLAPLLASS